MDKWTKWRRHRLVQEPGLGKNKPAKLDLVCQAMGRFAISGLAPPDSASRPGMKVNLSTRWREDYGDACRHGTRSKYCSEII